MVADNEMAVPVAVYGLLMYLSGFAAILYGRRSIAAAQTS